jgi:hypothetical protein
MQRPDHALQDATRLEFPVPGREPPEGLLLMTTDLGAFFRLVATVGRDEALLLLVIRALRIRDGLLDVSVNDLAWILRTRNRAVLGWLDRLVAERLVVYTVKALPIIRRTIDRVQVEIVESSSAAYAVMADVPTHWFVQVLPLVGRTTFVVYLYALSRESRDGVLLVAELATAVRLRGRFHAHLHLGRLRRRGLLVRDADGNDVLSDPPPPTRLRRLQLRFLALPFLRRSLAHLFVLGSALLLLVVLLVLLTLH